MWVLNETKRERKQMAVRLRFLCLVLMLSALSACGKKGPLYLPPGMIPVIKSVPQEPTVESTVEPAATPAVKNTNKTPPVVKPANKSQP